MIPEILGWIGNIGFLVGAILLCKRNEHTFLANYIANILYSVQAIILQNHSLFVLSIGLGFCNLYTIIKKVKLK